MREGKELLSGSESGERIDDLQLNGLRILQDPSGFRFGMDAVLLSGYVPAGAQGRLLDLGCGNGILPLLLSAKTACSFLCGLEIQARSVSLARRSVEMNALTDRIEIIEGDIKEAERLFAPASFDIVTSNPPYMVSGHGLTGGDDSRRVARHEVLCTLRDVVRAAAFVLREKGHFYMVHRPRRLTEILIELHAAGLEPKRMRFVHPRADREPGMVLIDSVRGGRPGLTVEPPLIVTDDAGEYTEELHRLYGLDLK